MSSGSMTGLYLVLGLGLLGGLYYALTQVIARHRRLNAELTRLEQLAAEVAMNAEAILERVDERIDRLNQYAAQLTAQAEAALTASQARAVVVPPSDEPPTAAPPQAPPARRGRVSRKGAAPVANEAAVIATGAEPDRPSLPSQEAVAANPPAQPESPVAPPKYQEMRTAVFALADQGKDASEIAHTLGVPRGEVQLILNLRGRKVIA